MGRLQLPERPGHLVEFTTQFQRAIGRQRECTQLGRVMFVAELVSLIRRCSLGARSAFIVTSLLHPEASRRTVEKTQNSEMIVLRGRTRQFDDRGSAVEHFASAIEDEMVVRGNEGKDQGQGSSE